MGGVLRLIRPAGGLTATTNVVAGALLVSGGSDQGFFLPLLLACLSSFCLYSGGMALNDLADRKRDRKSRPQRPIPSGAVSVPLATAVVCSLFLTGVSLAYFAGGGPGTAVAVLIVILIALYDLLTKRFGLVGAVNMGCCRFANVLLGAQVTGLAGSDDALFGIVPCSHGFVLLFYVTCITAISLFEDRRGSRPAFLLLSVLLVATALLPGVLSGPLALVVLLPFVFTLGRAALGVGDDLSRGQVEGVVRSAVLGMPFLDAGALFGAHQWEGAFFVLIVLFLARLVARRFAVT